MSTLDLEASWTAVDGMVRGYLHRRLGGDGATADDLAHEVFLRVRANLGTMRDARSFGPWVVRIARNVLIDHLRRRSDIALPDVEAVQPGDDHEDPADLAALAAYLQDQVEALPAHEAAAIRLVDVDGIAPAEAAARLGIGLPALKARLRRGRQHLRQAIARCCTVTLDPHGRPTDCEPRSGGPGCPACS